MVKKYGAQLAVLFFLLLAGCDDNGTARHPLLKLDPLKAGFLWKATYGDNAAYFFGTIPIGVESMYPLPDAVYAALGEADTLYFAGVSQEQRKEDFKRIHNKDGDEDQPLEGKEGEYKGLSNYYKNELIDIVGRKKYDNARKLAIEPYVFIYMLAGELMRQPFLLDQDTIETGLSPESVIKRGKKGLKSDTIPRRYLDEADQLVTAALLFDTLSPAEQIARLEDFIDNFESNREGIKRLIKPYKEGRSETIRQSLREDRQKAKTTFVAGWNVWDLTYSRPNRTYAREIAGILGRTGTEGTVSFVVLHAFHWIVEDSDNVIEELKRILPGVTIEQVDLKEFYGN